MNSIYDFWSQMTANPLLFLAVILTLGVILVNGWTDAPNAIATCVVTRCMPAKAAILMAAFFNFLGVFLMTLINATVAETITKMVDFGLDPDKAIIALSAALFSIVLWATLAWVFGIPTSESHALIAGLTGSAIAKAFIIPVDREDIDMLSNNLDDVIDKIEEILQKFYIYNIIEINTSAIEFAKKIVRACEILGELMCEFENYKKSKNIHNLIIKLNDVEEECDNLYLSSMRELSENNSDMLLIVSWCEIFNCFEACADACEHVSECVGSVIMKNT